MSGGGKVSKPFRMAKCGCINIQHRNQHHTKCQGASTHICDTCWESLCGSCAKRHHAHDTVREM